MVNAQLLPLRAPESMPNQSVASAPGQAKATRAAEKPVEAPQKKRHIVQSTLTRLPPQAASKVTHGGSNYGNHDHGKGQGTNRTKIDALRSLSSASRRPGPSQAQ